MTPRAEQGLLDGVLCAAGVAVVRSATAQSAAPCCSCSRRISSASPDSRPTVVSLIPGTTDGGTPPPSPAQRRTARVNDQAVIHTMPTVSTMAPGTWILRLVWSP